MTKNQIIALGAFIVLALAVLAFVPPPASLTERSVSEGVLLGTFEGTTPCADCPGIVQRLTLMQDSAYSAEGTYELSLTYLERDVEPFVESGRWTTERGTGTNPDATVYALYKGDGEVSQRFIRVDADTIRILDINGNDIESGLPYDLELVAEGASAAVLPNPATLAGTIICLPHKDTTGPQTKECAQGLRTDDGSNYALDLALLSDEERMTASGDARIEVTGTLVPIEILSSDWWMKYDVKGVVSVESIRAL
ncbi:MAG TPA: copper resistance protein NlpE [Candidatus Paceibacterota bacterium]